MGAVDREWGNFFLGEYSREECDSSEECGGSVEEYGGDTMCGDENCSTSYSGDNALGVFSETPFSERWQ